MNIMLLLLASTVLRPAPLPHPGITDPAPEVICMPALTVAGHHPETGTLTLRLTNGSPVPVSFMGYGDQVPLYAVQVLDGTEWVLPSEFRGWCGTGLDTRRLQPFSSLTFDVPVQPGRRIALTVHLEGAPDPLELVSPPLEP